MRKLLQNWFPVFPSKSIQSSISFAFSCLILCSIALISLFYYRLTESAVEKNSEAYIGEVMKQVDANLQSYVDNMENISVLAMTNKDVKYYISSSVFISEEDRRPYEKRISDLFQSILYTRKDIASIMVFGYNGRFVSDRRITSLNPNAKLEDQPWYANAKKEGGKSVISAPHVQNIIQNEYRWVVSLSRELKSVDGITGEGIFLVDLNMSVINEICNHIDLGKQGYVFIVDQSGNVVYHPQQQLIYSDLWKEPVDRVLQTRSGGFIAGSGADKRIYSVQDTRFGWKIVGVAYTSELIANKSTIRSSFILWMILGLSVTLLISFLLSHRLSRPIKSLQETMRKVEKGHFDVRAEISSNHEIGMLGRTFNLMVGQIKELMQQIIRSEEMKRRGELKVLQSQINPHFLYNTLDSIIWMAEEKRHEEVVEMTAALARVFRASIMKEDELVPIRVELEHISSYLLIQKMRYEEHLDYRIDVSPDILPCKTLKILLQPLVENAIYHGIKNKPGIGLIEIGGRAAGDDIVLTITDNGVGMDPERLRRLFEPETDPERRKGLGVVNVQERIKLSFGAPYGIRFESEPGCGTCVTITIPKLI